MKKFLFFCFAFFISTVFIMSIDGTKIAQAAPSVTVISPNGGEHFTQGETITIRWSQANTDRMTVQYIHNESSQNIIETITVNPQATEGSYQWTIPTTTSISGNNFRISLRAWETNVGASDDTSDGIFSISPRQLPPVTIALSPQTPPSSIIPRGDQYVPVFSFTITNSAQAPEVGIQLECNLIGLQFVSHIIKMRTKEGNDIITPTGCSASNIAPGQSRTFTVEVSYDGRDQGYHNQYDIYLEIISMQASSSVNEQLQVVGLPIRGKTFVIPAYSPTLPTPIINVLTPTTHETWTAGSTKTIRWTATNLPPQANNKVSLFFISPINGNGIGPVAQFENTGSAQFTVPYYDVGHTSLIRIALWCDAGQPLCSAHSDGTQTVTVLAGSPTPTPTPTPIPTPTSTPSPTPDLQNNTPSNLQVQNINNRVLYNRLKGNILIKPEDSGKAYYIHPSNEKLYFLGRPSDAFSVMREQGIGIRNKDLQKIPVGLEQVTGVDQDGDALSDLFEDSMGMNKNNRDSDGDGHDDRVELLGGYNPLGSGKLSLDILFTKIQHGRIVLQVEGKGEAWYINPQDGKRYFLGRPVDAFNVMRNTSMGISNKDFNSLE